MVNLMGETLQYVLETLVHNAPVLLLGILVAAAITVYVDPDKMRQALMKQSGMSIGASVAFGAFTPFCACGTMAVIVAMMTTALPWGPIMAFLTSSPLMSPDEFILYAGIVNVKFAVALTAASVLIGLFSGVITHWIEKKTGFLTGQARFAEIQAAASCCGTVNDVRKVNVGTGFGGHPVVIRYKLAALLKVVYDVGIRQVLLYFTVFAAIGFLINRFVPAELIMSYLGAGNPLAVPLLALIGLPLYVNGSSAIPLINALVAGGASQGALLAFMITGPGTSAGVIAGLVTIMKKRAIMLYVLYLIVFAVFLGYAYDWLLGLGF